MMATELPCRNCGHDFDKHLWVDGVCPCSARGCQCSKFESFALCHRCEHRVGYLETGSGPRSECKSTGSSVHSCYMYRPVRPCILRLNRGESRPMLAGGAFAGRSHSVGIHDGQAVAVKVKDGITILYRKAVRKCRN